MIWRGAEGLGWRVGWAEGSVRGVEGVKGEWIGTMEVSVEGSVQVWRGLEIVRRGVDGSVR